MTEAVALIVLVLALLFMAPDLGRAAARFLGWLLALATFLALAWLQGFALVHELYWRAAWLASGIS